jgi:hypothetical protein
MVCLLEEGRPCFQKTPEKQKHLQEGLDQINEESIQNQSN